MFSKFSRQRSVQTTIPCKICASKLVAMRTCHEAFLRCPKCGKESAVQDYISQMDSVLEEFLESINCDRV